MANTRGQFQVDFLRSVVESGGRVVGARFSLQRGPLKDIEPIYAVTLEQNKLRLLQALPWTPELERYLLESRQRMETLPEEADRFAAILLNNIQASAAQFGRGFTHAVLVTVLLERPQYGLAAFLRRAATPKPSRSSRHFRECAQFLESSVDGLREIATRELAYSADAVEILMTKVLVIVLDETFHLSGAELLFPKHA
jgi:hypothetical protein